VVHGSRVSVVSIALVSPPFFAAGAGYKQNSRWRAVTDGCGTSSLPTRRLPPARLGAVRMTGAAWRGGDGREALGRRPIGQNPRVWTTATAVAITGFSTPTSAQIRSQAATHRGRWPVPHEVNVLESAVRWDEGCYPGHKRPCSYRRGY